MFCLTVEGRIQFGEAMLAKAGVAGPDVEALSAVLRSDDCALIRRPAAPDA